MSDRGEKPMRTQNSGLSAGHIERKSINEMENIFEIDENDDAGASEKKPHSNQLSSIRRLAN